MKISKALAAKVLNVVDEGLSCGLGDPEPGKMCVEAAVNYAMGGDHNDQPKCVNPDLVGFKIGLNDEGPWKGNMDRARALRRIAIAQLGTKGMKDFWLRFIKEFRHVLYTKWVLRQVDRDIKADKLKGLEKDKRLFAREMLIKYRDDVVNQFNDDGDGLSFGRKSRELISEISNADGPDELIQIFTQLNRKEALEFIEDAVQVLKKMKTPGSKYLSLTT